ncbi:MAG: FGGY family carbohydrate kinase [Aliidongia sp.]
MPELLLALDVGTTSARALLIAPGGAVLALAQETLRSRFPGPGLVEQDGREIWDAALAVMHRALKTAGRSGADLAAIGVTTQRASTVVWDRDTAEPVAPVLVWSDLRGMARYRSLRDAGFQSWPQVPACKLEAALDLAEEGRGRAARGELCWGTLDAYLVFRLSGGGAHVTDLSAAWLTGYLDGTGAGWNVALIAHQGLAPTLFPTIGDSWGPIATAAHGVLARQCRSPG